MKLIRWIFLIFLLFLCISPLNALENRLMIGIELLNLEWPLVVIESTISTSPLGGWFQQEVGLRLRTLILANLADLVLRSVIRFPRTSIGIEYSPMILFNPNPSDIEWFPGIDVAFFIRLMNTREQGLRESAHLSVGTGFNWYDDSIDFWYLSLKVGFVWRTKLFVKPFST